MKVGVIMSKKYFSLKEVQGILLDIIDKEFSNISYSIDLILNTNKQNDKKILGICRDNEIEVYVNNYFHLCDLKEKLLYMGTQHVSQKIFVRLLKTTYHECFHILEQLMPSRYITELDYFLVTTERPLRKTDGSYYDKNWHLFYDEMLADLYGNIKAREFLKENYPDVLDCNESWLNDELVEIKKRFVFFDYNHTYQKNYKDYIHEDNSDKFISVKAIYDMYKDFDERIVYYILTLDLFLEQLDINNLSDEEITIMELAIEYAYNKELLKKDYIDNNFKLDKLSKEDAIYYRDNIDKMKYFEEIDRMIKSTRKINILKKAKMKYFILNGYKLNN